ncbi:hypothetical protein MTO96_040354 [Rhipicephalus appendiculatus]
MARPRPRKSAAALPKKPKLEKATSSAPSVAKDPTAGTTPDAAIDVEAEWEARYGWRVEEAVASTVGVQVDIVRNVVNMLSNDCTIPFIARYRREQTGGLQADGLQDIQDTYASLLQVKKKARTILETLTKENKGGPQCAQAHHWCTQQRGAGPFVRPIQGVQGAFPGSEGQEPRPRRRPSRFFGERPRSSPSIPRASSRPTSKVRECLSSHDA